MAAHTRTFSWSSPRERVMRRFFAVLQTDKIDSPVAAMWAAIVAGHRKREI
jgi:hypothetical protein